MIRKGSCSQALFSFDGVAVFIGETNGGGQMNKKQPGLTNGTTQFPISLSPPAITTTHDLAYLFAPYKWKIRVMKKISLCFFSWTQYFPRILARWYCIALLFPQHPTREYAASILMFEEPVAR